MKSIVTALVDPSGAADYGPDAHVEIWSELPVGITGGVATDRRLRVDITATGLSTPPIRAGNYQIRIKLSANREALGPYPFTMPDGDGTTELWPLIAAAVNIPPDTPVQKIQEALAAYLIANPIDGNGLDQTAVDARIETVGDTRYAPLWQASTAYATDAPVLLPAPVSAVGKRTAAGISRATFDATEQALWTVTVGGGTTTVDGLTDATTVGKAVAKAADAEAARNAIGAPSSTDARLPNKELPEGFAIADSTGKEAFAVNADGTLMLGSAQYSDDGVSLDITGLDNTIALRIGIDGAVTIPDLKSMTQPTAVHILIGAGQSNMEGQGLPNIPDYDPVDARIFQYGWKAGAISQATPILDMIGTGVGLSPLTVIAREYIKRQSPDTVVLLIPAGKGNSGLTVDVGNGTWDAAVSGNYYTQMIAKIAAARTAATTRWGFAPQVKAFFWHQGETDGLQDVASATYASAFDALVSALRTAVGIADLPVIVGGMNPDWYFNYSNRVKPSVAHIATPVRLTRAAYAEGVRNGGGAQNTTDLIHYHREAVVVLGERMFAAYARALANTAASIPYPPLRVTGSLIAGELNIEWSAPLCRFTSFTVYWTIDAGTEQSAVISSGATSHQVTGIGGTRASIAVATTNPVGTSARTTAVKIGA